MAVAVMARGRTRQDRLETAGGAYLALTRRLAAAAVRGDDARARRLVVAREELLAVLRARGWRPSHALAAEVRSLEARTMLALGVDPLPVRRPAWWREAAAEGAALGGGAGAP
jgi:hypothetical protein